MQVDFTLFLALRNKQITVKSLYFYRLSIIRQVDACSDGEHEYQSWHHFAISEADPSALVLICTLDRKPFWKNNLRKSDIICKKINTIS